MPTDDKPTPNGELVIIPFTQQRPHILQAWVLSTDARLWIESEAPKFGALYEERTHFQVWIHPCFNASEVAAYLSSYGTPPQNAPIPLVARNTGTWERARDEAAMEGLVIRGWKR